MVLSHFDLVLNWWRVWRKKRACGEEIGGGANGSTHILLLFPSFLFSFCCPNWVCLVLIGFRGKTIFFLFLGSIEVRKETTGTFNVVLEPATTSTESWQVLTYFYIIKIILQMISKTNHSLCSCFLFRTKQIDIDIAKRKKQRIQELCYTFALFYFCLVLSKKFSVFLSSFFSIFCHFSLYIYIYIWVVIFWDYFLLMCNLLTSLDSPFIDGWMQRIKPVLIR